MITYNGQETSIQYVLDPSDIKQHKYIGINTRQKLQLEIKHFCTTFLNAV